jgi:hypothetical protein
MKASRILLLLLALAIAPQLCSQVFTLHPWADHYTVEVYTDWFTGNPDVYGTGVQAHSSFGVEGPPAGAGTGSSYVSFVATPDAGYVFTGTVSTWMQGGMHVLVGNSGVDYLCTLKPLTSGETSVVGQDSRWLWAWFTSGTMHAEYGNIPAPSEGFTLTWQFGFYASDSGCTVGIGNVGLGAGTVPGVIPEPATAGAVVGLVLLGAGAVRRFDFRGNLWGRR